MNTTSRDAVIRKIEALLAKAGSTGFQAEAEALAAKAQELMARYLIEHHELGAEDGASMIRRTFTPTGAYAAERIRVLCGVAQANGVYAYWNKGGGPPTAVLFGRADVIELVFATFALLDTQLVRQLSTVGAGRRDVRAFRHAFVLGFAAAIRRRLAEQVRTIEADSPGVGLVLADALSEAERFFRQQEPDVRLRTVIPRLSSWEGVEAGRRSGATADLGGRRIDGRPALGAG
ncbi:MAG: DUF2786 domain-containing protein [Acidimicrobiales bacterium]|nr:DUF2786 domain-containing protein [Acidimicrobiales bacterium]